jgi:hypothetical protein
LDRIVAGQVIAVEYRSHDVEEDCRCGVVLAVVCLDARRLRRRRNSVAGLQSSE